ncbi:S53 family peptidase [Mycobacteroides abscessus]|uniref:S53 family peptidase n=1 Tax=Mycobacteroides abscessus TaxID=36809 RepID=UPI0009AB9BE1|nr:S53 family peptidase [Mycobacteroides abscessus]
MTKYSRVDLPASRYPALPSSAAVEGAVDPGEEITTTVFVRRRAPIPEVLLTTSAAVSEQEFTDKYGADPADIERVCQAVTDAGAQVLSTNALSCRIKVRGDAATLAELFGADMRNVSSPSPHTGQMMMHRAVQGALSVPGPLQGVVTAVMGLDDRPLFKRASGLGTLASAAVVPQAWTVSAAQLAAAYQFPAASGAGCRIAILEFGGGYVQSDLDTYFSNLSIPVPSVTSKSVDGAQNNPAADMPPGSDLETTFDIEVAGALAPGASIEVYFAPNTAQNYVDAYWSVFAPPRPTVCSVSWDFIESRVPPSYLSAMNDALGVLAAFNVTHINSSGDWGSAGAKDGPDSQVCYPASSPFTLAVGGTELAVTSGGQVASEVVWNTLDGADPGASGGGYSRVYSTPDWQKPVVQGNSFRGVPDVAAMASSRSRYEGWMQGQPMWGYGTSFATPLWAALLCRIAELLGRQAGMGFINPLIYPKIEGQTSFPGFRDIADGNIGAYHAAAGWDPCTGLGVPRGVELLEHLRTQLQ